MRRPRSGGLLADSRVNVATILALLQSARENRPVSM